jgi:hypothetical protein
MSADANVDADANEDLSQRIATILRTRGEMSPETCARVRRLACNGNTPTEIADDDDIDIQRAESTVRQHARGQCNHEIDEEPITPPYNTRHAPITRDECARIRRRRALGIRASYIAQQMGCDESTVYAHENGQCSHDGREADRGEQT